MIALCNAARLIAIPHRSICAGADLSPFENHVVKHHDFRCRRTVDRREVRGLKHLDGGVEVTPHQRASDGCSFKEAAGQLKWSRITRYRCRSSSIVGQGGIPILPRQQQSEC
jgi:hypothetical protein